MTQSASNIRGLVKKLTFICLLSCPTLVIAEDFFSWHSSNIQVLHGQSFKLGDETRTIVTVEHANAFKYGDFFAFWDQSFPESGSASYYFEPTLRFSANKIRGKKIQSSWLNDVLFAASLEKAEGRDWRKLVGMGIDFKVSGFKFVKTNWYLRDNPDLSGTTYQLTIAWLYPLKFGSVSGVFEGFTDIAGSEGTASAYQLVVPRLLFDIGQLVGIPNNQLYAGVEWQYWHNKFGRRGVTESVPQLQLKYVF